jgi:hypothetical protein
MCAVEDSIPHFFNDFFPQLLDLFTSPSISEAEGLDVYLLTAGRFLMVNDVCLHNRLLDLPFLASFFTRFIYHVDTAIQGAALQATSALVLKHPGVLRERAFLDQTLFERLAFLGRQRSSDLCKAVSELLSLVLMTQDFPCVGYRTIGVMIQLDLRYQGPDYSRKSVLALLALALANPEFTRVADVDALIKAFLKEYQLFRLKERNEAACVVANAMGFLPETLVQGCFQMEGFADAILDMLELESDDALLPLINGLSRGLHVIIAAGQKTNTEYKEKLSKALEELKENALSDVLVRNVSVVLTWVHRLEVSDAVVYPPEQHGGYLFPEVGLDDILDVSQEFEGYPGGDFNRNDIDLNWVDSDSDWILGS